MRVRKTPSAILGGSNQFSAISLVASRTCDIRWSTYFLDDTPHARLLHPVFCIVQVNNVTNSPLEPEGTRLVAFERPQVVFRYYSGRTGKLLYAEGITALDN